MNWSRISNKPLCIVQILILVAILRYLFESFTPPVSKVVTKTEQGIDETRQGLTELFEPRFVHDR